MKRILSAHETRLLRLRAQRLLPADGPPDHPAVILKEVFGVQAQDLPAARLSIRARSTGLTAVQVETARQAERALVWTWCMRGTLHLIAADDARWLIPLLGPGLVAADRRRFEQLGWDEARAAAGIRLVQAALRERDGLTRPEIIRLLEENHLPFEGQAPIHLIYRAAAEGILCAGPDREGGSTYVLLEPWLGELQPLPHPQALAEMARRYLQAYGPAAPEDLASWSGLNLAAARQAWKFIEDLLLPVEAAGQAAWLLKSQHPWLDERLDQQNDPTPFVRLLPRFDTYLLGYASRTLTVDPAHTKRIHPGGGIIHPVLLVDGRAAGIWKTRRRSTHLEIRVESFGSLAGELLPLIRAEVADLARFLGEEADLIVADPGNA